MGVLTTLKHCENCGISTRRFLDEELLIFFSRRAVAHIQNCSTVLDAMWYLLAVYIKSCQANFFLGRVPYILKSFYQISLRRSSVHYRHSVNERINFDTSPCE